MKNVFNLNGLKSDFGNFKVLKLHVKLFCIWKQKEQVYGINGKKNLELLQKHFVYQV